MHYTRVAAAALLALLSLGAVATDGANTQETMVTVTVDVRCDGSKVDFSVDPWTASLAQGEGIQWVLAQGAHTESLTITNKRGAGNWPFADSPPYKGGRADPPSGHGMKPNQAGQKYQYNIELTCSSEGSGPYEVVIDPAMIIKDG